MDKLQKKQYREAFENKKVKMGIMGVRNLVSGTLYIKPTLNAEAWINKTKFILKMGQFDHPALQSDWTAMGEAHFEFCLLATLKESDSPFFDPGKELKKLEQTLIESLNGEAVKRY